MKKLFLTIAVAALFMFGCQDENSLVQPVQNQIKQNTAQKTWLKLTDKSGNAVETDYFQKNKSINGSKGDKFDIKFNFNNGVTVNGNLVVPQNAFKGKMNISVNVNSSEATATFYPSPYTFNYPLSYTVEYHNLDLSGINPSTIDFYYLAEDGSLQKANYDSIEVDIETGYLKVVNAQLPHFSRYGFVN